MKKLIISALCVVLCLPLFSCTSEKSLYGTWYNDSNGERNAIQLSENKDGKSVFVWAIYDIEKDEVTSQSEGYFHTSGSTISFKYKDGDNTLELSFELGDTTLRLYNDTASLTLEKYELN